MKFSVLLICFLAACGSTPPNQKSVLDADIHEDGTSLSATEKPEPEPAEAKPVPITTVTRVELDAILKKGPGYVLGLVQTDSVKKNGKFVGFKIVGLRLNAPAVLGVQPGDVIHHINGISIEKPMALVNIFEKLKTATTVDFSLTRNGEELSLSTPVQ